ncbi:MAG: hypothetical protein ACI9UJ_002492, partial [bacterium]
MKKSLKYISIVFLAIAIQSCNSAEPIPENELPSFQSKLVVNCALSNIEPIEIKVSDNAGAYSNDLPSVYSDVQVSLKADGSTVSMVYNSVSRSFKSTQKAISGKTYALEVKDQAGEKQTVFARSFIPEKVFNKNVGYVENGGVDIDGRPSDLLSIEWTDQAGSNYYMLHFYYYSVTVDLFVPFDFTIN